VILIYSIAIFGIFFIAGLLSDIRTIQRKIRYDNVRFKSALGYSKYKTRLTYTRGIPYSFKCKEKPVINTDVLMKGFRL
jgi:hypothetical protein